MDMPRHDSTVLLNRMWLLAASLIKEYGANSEVAVDATRLQSSTDRDIHSAKVRRMGCGPVSERSSLLRGCPNPRDLCQED